MQRGETINILLPGPCNIQISAAHASLTRGSIARIRSVRHRQQLFDLQSTRNNSIHIENAQNRDLSFSITTRNNDNEQLLSEVFYNSGTNVLVVNKKWRYTRWTVDALMDPRNDGYLHPMSKSDLLNIELLPDAFQQFGRNRIDISIGNGGHIGLFFTIRKLIQVRFNPRYYVARTLDNIDRLYTNWLFNNRELIAPLANPNAQNVAPIQGPIELGADVVIDNRNRIEGVVELANPNAQNVALIQNPIELGADVVIDNRNRIEDVVELANPNAQNVAPIQDPLELGSDVVIANRNRIEGVVELANPNAQNVATIQDPIELGADVFIANRNQIVAKNYSLEHFLQENAEKVPIESDARHRSPNS